MTQLHQILIEATREEASLASGAVAIIGVDGAVANSAAAGATRRPAHSMVSSGAIAVTLETRFDLASITKLFTAAALLAILDERGLRDTDYIVDVLPEFGDGASRFTTFADLLRHTAGMPAEWLDRSRDVDAWPRFRTTRPDTPPKTRFRYSCVSYIWAGLAAEALTGERLDRVIGRTLLDPLGLKNTGFNPPDELCASIPATEFQAVPDRGLVQGKVHDETAWVLGGVSGNAGMFGTAGDLFRFVEMIRIGGVHEGRRVLPGWAIEAMTTDQLPTDLVDRPTYGQALGPRMGEALWMSSLAHRGAVGHTGFTGTSALTVPGGAHSVILLTNRVHPSRHGTDPTALRRVIADYAAQL